MNEDYNTIYDDIECVKNQVKEYQDKIDEAVSKINNTEDTEESYRLQLDVAEYAWMLTVWNRCLKNLLAVEKEQKK